ncbi:Predicted flavoprotein CzcO associated with the cation diffusion facilitator CzcD [Acidocella aminolytica 101 = DSM 11237]|jgi:cation diffusion facilitator CzcD-associated flavoprotein CzcO|nr:putative flavoprotein [Acidocella aminolytica 101 = DSM 11237]SHE61345.1 Predicted flavoprotein CzcO associated with the cation diffusion facilitator CzcD [Acidocella aminolytica 101 = DSM 11237]
MDQMSQPRSEALALLSARVRHDLACLDYPARPWVRPHASPEGHVYDVVVIGGGQSGLAAAFGLMREKVGNILVIDENPQGQEGPWVTYARMVTLRTPKHLISVDLGVPSLTFRAWWEAQYGSEGWEALGKIPRGEWMRYLVWYRETLDLPVRNECKAVLIEPVERGLFRVKVEGQGAPVSGRLLARKVVLATGIQGGGEWHTPDFIKALPKARYAHTAEAVDYAAMKGHRIGILGGGASAFDNAQYALGEGVKQAHVFIRKPELPKINPIRFMENSGFLGHFSDLSDAQRYEGIDHFLSYNQPPTNDTFNRAAAYEGFVFHPGEPWLSVKDMADGVEVTTPNDVYLFDFLVLSTGLLTDARLRPELALLAEEIACWRDKYQPPKPNKLIDDHPYLKPDFSFTAKTPEGEGLLHGLFNFNYAALASLGLSASALSGMKFAAPKLIYGIVSQLFVDDAPEILADYKAYAEEEFTGGVAG